MGTVLTSGSCLSDSMRSIAWPKGVPNKVPNTWGVRPGIAGSGMTWSLLRLVFPACTVAEQVVALHATADCSGQPRSLLELG